MPHSDQVVSMRIRQRFEQDAVEHAEDGGVRSDTDCQSNERDRGEQGCAAEAAENLVELREAHGG